MIEIEKLRYPIGKFSAAESISEDDIRSSILIIERLPSRLRSEVVDLTDEQLDTPYRDGGWTIRQVVHHLPDSHLNAYIRFKLAITEDNPTIRPYMEDKWAALPDGKSAGIVVSLDLLESLHKRWVAVIRNMSVSDFSRTFYHPEDKVTRTLGVNLYLYAWHSRHHLAHITELKKRKGW